MKLVKFYSYRTSIGSVKGSQSLVGDEATVVYIAICKALNLTVDNHTSIVFENYDKVFIVYYSDGKLYFVNSLIAGDCNKDYGVGKSIPEYDYYLS